MLRVSLAEGRRFSGSIDGEIVRFFVTSSHHQLSPCLSSLTLVVCTWEDLPCCYGQLYYYFVLFRWFFARAMYVGFLAHHDGSVINCTLCSVLKLLVKAIVQAAINVETTMVDLFAWTWYV